MFFEGSEKKIELVQAPHVEGLLDRPDKYWHQLVKACGAEIISEVNTPSLRAFLLSESSLFVWDDRFLMITCGTTVLANAVLHYLEDQPFEQVSSLIFQRKNEYCSALQKTTFFEDVEALKKRVGGVAYRLGHLDLHHNFLYHKCQNFEAPENDSTLEILMYHLDSGPSQFLRKEGLKTQEIRDFLRLGDLFGDYTIDDFVFEPFGYSLNGIKEDCYITMHITPQDESSYVSFETNAPLTPEQVISHFVQILGPQSFDVIRFNTPGRLKLEAPYLCIQDFSQPINCGYQVDFEQYIRELSGEERAVKMTGGLL